jgi:hypothetical protein
MIKTQITHFVEHYTETYIEELNIQSHRVVISLLGAIVSESSCGV